MRNTCQRSNIIARLNRKDYIVFTNRSKIALIPEGAKIISSGSIGPWTAINDQGQISLGEEFDVSDILWENVKEWSYSYKGDRSF